MATDPSLDGTGLTVLRTAEVRENITEAIHGSSEWGESAQTGADHALGQLIDPVSEQLGLAYELIQALWDAWSPDTAEGIHLDNLVQLLGIVREPATASTAVLTLTGTPSGVVPAGSRARVPDGPIFALDADATIGGGGTVDAQATATETGSLEAAAGTITEIVDADPDWSAVTNASDATLGEEIETDAELKLRRDLSLSRAGRSTDFALRAALEAIDDVTAAVVISNRAITTVDGIPPKSFEPIVWPDTIDAAAQEEVAETIWRHTPNGIPSHGTESATATDSQGFSQTIKWSYATEVEIYWVIDVTTNANYPAGGDQLVEDQVLAYGNALSVGDDVLPIGAVDAIYDEVPGVDHLVVKVKAGGAPGAGDIVPVTIAAREISDHDSTRVTVNS